MYKHRDYPLIYYHVKATLHCRVYLKTKSLKLHCFNYSTPEVVRRACKMFFKRNNVFKHTGKHRKISNCNELTCQ